MTIVNEAKIRDFLAENLNFLDPGSKLCLIDKEFSIKNSAGGNGRIDILAKDFFGHYVVIEIKRSNTSARQAIHELHKYVALLRQELGIQEEKIRCIVASTEWHELLVPFWEFKKSVNFHVEGVQLVLDPKTKLPESKKAVRENSIQEPRKIYPGHHIHLFSNELYRKQAVNLLKKQLENFGIKDFLLIFTQYEGTDETVIFKYAIHLILYKIESARQKDVKESLFSNSDFEHQNDLESVEHLGESLEEHVLSRISLHQMSDIDPIISYQNLSLEFGYPEKFHSMLKRDWNINSIYRHGYPKKIKRIKSNKELINEILGIGDNNSELFLGISNSKFESSWKGFISRLYTFLNTNGEWLLLCEALFNQYSLQNEEIVVSARIYDAVNFLDALCMTAWTSEFFLPTLDIFIEIPQKNQYIVLKGFLEWNRRKYPSAKNIFKDSYDLFEECRLTWKTDISKSLLVMVMHGFRHSILEFYGINKNDIIASHIEIGDNDEIQRLKYDKKRVFSLRNFVQSNPEYMSQLKHLHGQTTDFGLPYMQNINWGNINCYPPGL